MKMLPVVTLVFAMLAIACPAIGAIYEWVDDRGVTNFTDNVDNIPKKYLKRAKSREVVPEAAPPQAPAVAGEKPVSAAPAAPSQFGGRKEAWWRSEFAKLRQEMKNIEDGLPAKRDKLTELRRKKAIYQRGSDRSAYNGLLTEIKRDEGRLKELQDKLGELDVEAGRAGVPLEWRQ